MSFLKSSSKPFLPVDVVPAAPAVLAVAGDPAVFEDPAVVEVPVVAGDLVVVEDPAVAVFLVVSEVPVVFELPVVSEDLAVSGCPEKTTSIGLYEQWVVSGCFRFLSGCNWLHWVALGLYEDQCKRIDLFDLHLLLSL